jgi:hypothetical protein
MTEREQRLKNFAVSELGGQATMHDHPALVQDALTDPEKLVFGNSGDAELVDVLQRLLEAAVWELEQQRQQDTPSLEGGFLGEACHCGYERLGQHKPDCPFKLIGLTGEPA